MLVEAPNPISLAHPTIVCDVMLFLAFRSFPFVAITAGAARFPGCYER